MQVGTVLHHGGRDADDHDVAAGQHRRVGAEGEPSRLLGSGEQAVAHPRHDVASGGELSDTRGVDVDGADDQPFDGRGRGERQPDVSLPDDAEDGRPTRDPALQLLDPHSQLPRVSWPDGPRRATVPGRRPGTTDVR
jgi:hypothetical protein